MRKITKLEVLLAISVVVLIIFLFRSCGKVKVIEKPAITTVAEQKPIQQADLAIKKRVEDSMAVIISAQDNTIRRERKKYDELMADYINQANGITTTLTMEVPDTCKPMQKLLQDKFAALSRTSKSKDEQCVATINSLQKQGTNKDNLIKSKDAAYKKLQSNLDTCFKNQSALETYSKKLEKAAKPRNHLFVGITGISGITGLSQLGGGINLSLMNKKGIIYDVGVLQFQKATQVTVGVKVKIF